MTDKGLTPHPYHAPDFAPDGTYIPCERPHVIAHEHEPYDSHGSIDPKIPHEHVAPASRVLRDLLVCIAEREELDEEHMSGLVRYVIANEQEIWNEIIGPVIDRIADLEVEA